MPVQSRRGLPPTRLVAMMAAGVLILSACASGLTRYGAPPPPTPGALAAATAAATPVAADAGAGDATAVVIKEFAFGPATLHVPAGSTVTWSNQDLVAHTVTADDGSFDSGNLQFEQDFQQTFRSPGTFSYLCAIHPTMVATVVVDA